MGVSIRLSVMVAAVMSLTACENGTIYKEFMLGSDTSITTGARQRVVINHNPNLMTRPGTVTPARIVCAEPSPDVAAVIASAFGAGLSVPGTGAASVAANSSEALAQLAERTGAVQVLRERMFRACEAYSNGAITGTTYTILMNRFDRAMTTVLFGEIAGGAFGRSLAAIGGKASSEASASLSGASNAISNINESAEALAKAEKDLSDAERALADEKKKESPDQAKVTELTTAKDTAKGKRDATRQLLQTHVATAAKGTSDATALTAAGGVAAKPNKDVAAVMRDMHSKFLDSNPLDDYIAACLVELERNDVSNNYISAKEHRDKLLESLAGKPLTAMHGRSLAVLNPFGRRSGLFDHCRLHLASLAELRQRGIVSLKGFELELKKKELATQEAAARGSATAAYGKAMEQCNKIAVDSVKAQCIATLEKLQKKDPQSVIAAFQDFERASTLDTNVEILPTVMLDRANAKIVPLTMVRTNLNALAKITIDPAKDDAATQAKKKKQNTAIDKLIVIRMKLSSDAQTLISTATNKTNSTERGKLRVIENKRPDLRGKLQNATTELEKEKQQTALRLQFLEAKQKFDEYAVLLGKLETKTGELEAHSKVMKAAGAK